MFDVGALYFMFISRYTGVCVSHIIVGYIPQKNKTHVKQMPHV